ncbi:MAG: pirin family protein [Pseudomonadales bacterium]|nr:pirin family protein [Pseudomonadales bacterium]
MDYFRPGRERGVENFGWLNSYHSFSFGHYYDPKHMGLSVLRVINDDRVLGGAGFDTHGHRDMEIISYIMEGSIEHQDSMGNRFVVPAGEVQRMSAGTGITHSEYNASKTDPLRFLQIWIRPNQQGITPSYEQAAIEQTEQLTPLVTPDGENGSLSMHQDAYLYRLRLAPNETFELTVGDRVGYLHIIDGETVADDVAMEAGDGGAIIETSTMAVHAGQEGLEALWFDLPKES